MTLPFFPLSHVMGVVKYFSVEHNWIHNFLYVWKHSTIVSEQTMLFSAIKLKLFFCFPHLLNNEITNNLYVCESVIVWPFCVCNAKCVIISIYKYLQNSTLFDTIIRQFNTSIDFYVNSCSFLWFLLNFLVFVVLSQSISSWTSNCIMSFVFLYIAKLTN